MKVKISKMDNQGRGISYACDKILFLPRTLLGEEVSCHVTKEKKTYLEGEVDQIITPSPLRILPPCPYYGKCGGCDFQHVSYADSVKMKEEMLQGIFQSRHLWNKAISVCASREDYHYRNKVSLKVRGGKLGYYFPQTHEFLAIHSCMIVMNSINQILLDFSSFSFLNGDLVIRSNENNEVLIDITTNEEVSFDDDFFLRHKVAGILVNHECVYGDPCFFERKNGVLYQVSSESFFQVNPWISTELFRYVKEITSKAKNVLDLYCGVGTMGLQIAKKVEHVTGIEVVAKAIMNAMLNAKLNQVSNVSFHLGKVEALVSKIPMEFDTVILDPPRSGMDGDSLSFLLEKKPTKIIYISCNPMTLVRDLKKLLCSYQILSVRGFDMFPYTKHVECVCVLSLK